MPPPQLRQLLAAGVLVALAVAQAAPLQPLHVDTAQLDKCRSDAGLTALAEQLKLSSPRDAAKAAALWIFLYPAIPVADAAINTGIKPGAINKLLHLAEVVNPQTQFEFGIVTPNADTLYSTGWLDLSAGGPVVITAPDTKGRYWMLQLLDTLTNVIGTPGSPEGDGRGPYKFVVLPPGVKAADLPAALRSGVTRVYSSDTAGVWMIGRVFARDASDAVDAHKLQLGLKVEQVTIKPGAKAITSAAASPSAQIALAAQPLVKASGWQLSSVVNATAAFVASLGLVQDVARRHAKDAAAGPLGLAPSLGLVPAKGLSQAPLSAAQQAVLADGWALGQGCITSYVNSGQLGVTLKYGWSFPDKAGTYGSNYLLRAAVALAGLGANAPTTAIYMLTNTDEAGRPISGARGAVYRITFKGAPPVTGFASLTLYNATNKMLPVVKGGPSRSSFNFPGNAKELQKDADGGVTIWLSEKPPPAPKSNWLAIGGDGPSYAVLRLYGPSKEALTGKWQAPPITKVA